jgi:hypothetical protein
MPPDGTLDGELGRIYAQLSQAERRAWLRMGEVLLQMRTEQSDLQRPDDVAG